MEILENISWKELDCRVVAVNTSTGIYFTMNETASIIWKAMADGLSEKQIVDKLIELTDMQDKSVLSADVGKQLKDWEKNCLIKM